MKRRIGIVSAAVVACSFASVDAATIGLNPSDGVNKFVRKFAVTSGTTITGAQFANNDDETVFPVVWLVEGGTDALSEGSTIRTASNVTETAAGVVSVTWTTSVPVTESGTYYVAIVSPEGAGKVGNGNGPGIGASWTGASGTSFIATGETGVLNPVGVDLEVSLVTSGGGPGKAGQTPAVAQTFLGDASPNPFNPSTTIEFGVAEAGSVQLAIYDVSGRNIRVLASGSLDAGSHSRVWDGRDAHGAVAAAGVYFARLRVGSVDTQKKLILVK